MKGFGNYMKSDGWVWVGVFILVSLMQGRATPAFDYIKEFGVKYFY